MNGNRAKIRITNKKNRGLIRLSVFRSNAAIHASLIDDSKGETLATVSSKAIKAGKPIEKATEMGKLIAAKAKELKISEVVYDRNNYKYHGRVKALAEGAREAGLKL